MRFLPVATLVFAVLPAFAGPPGTAPNAAVSARSAEGRAVAIDRTSKRIDYVVGQGRKDRFELMVDVYRGYTDDQLRDPKRGVTLDNLLEIVKNDVVPKDVRTRAAETMYLERVIPNDPTLSLEGRREHRKRAEFLAKVNKLLLDNDGFVRQLAKNIMEALWVGWAGRVPALKTCDARERSTCVEANRAWTEVLKK